MKSLLIVLATLFTVSFASASNPADFPSDFPKDWALAMASMACGVDVTDDMYGKTTKSGKRERVYTIYNSSGQVVAKAWASSGYVWAKKVCLSN